jgi:hypothetical protein
VLGELAGHVAKGEVEVFGVVGEVHSVRKVATQEREGQVGEAATIRESGACTWVLYGHSAQ